jgi:MICOS complex subunit MIC26
VGAAVGTQTTSFPSPFRSVYAEAPPKDQVRPKAIISELGLTYLQLPEKKPIYSPYPVAPTNPKPSSTSPVTEPNPTSPTPTDRVAEQVKHARLFLYRQTFSAEQSFDSFLTWAFRKETNFSNTIASLAPKPETGEQLLPGVIYVLVATLTGSIISRNRGILLRTATPLVVGIAAGWYLIPVTMRNASDLIWEYEKKVPSIAITHQQISEVVQEAWIKTRGYTQGAAEWADEQATEARKNVEAVIKKGK